MHAFRRLHPLVFSRSLGWLAQGHFLAVLSRLGLQHAAHTFLRALTIQRGPTFKKFHL